MSLLDKDKIALQKAIADSMRQFNPTSFEMQPQPQPIVGSAPVGTQNLKFKQPAESLSLSHFKDEILVHITYKFGTLVVSGIVQLIERYNSEHRFEDKRNCLIMILLLLSLCDDHTKELMLTLCEVFSAFLKVSPTDQSNRMLTIADIQARIQSDQSMCSSLIIGNYEFEYLLSLILEDLSISIIQCDRSTLATLISNDQVLIIETLLKNTHADLIHLPKSAFSHILENSAAKETAETAEFIFSSLKKKHSISDRKYHEKKFYTLSSLFSLLLKKNSERLWRGMLQYLQGLDDGFIVSKSMIKEANKLGRLDFIVWSLKLFQERTCSILIRDDVFFELLNQINSTNTFSDVIAVLNYLYFSIVNRQQQEFLVEIFTALLEKHESEDEEGEGGEEVESEEGHQYKTKDRRQSQTNVQQKQYEQKDSNEKITNRQRNIAQLYSYRSHQSVPSQYSSEGNNVLREVSESRQHSTDEIAQSASATPQQKREAKVKQKSSSSSTFGHLSEIRVCKSFLLFTLSPIVSCALIARMFFELSLLDNSPLKEKLNKLASGYLQLLMKFCESLDDLRDWKILLFECVYPSHERLIDITRKHKQFFSPFLSINNIKSTMFIKWKSEYQFDASILTCSSASNVITRRFHDLSYDETDSENSESEEEQDTQQQIQQNKKVSDELQSSSYQLGESQIVQNLNKLEKKDADNSMTSPFNQIERSRIKQKSNNDGVIASNSLKKSNEWMKQWFGLRLIRCEDISNSIPMFYSKRMIEHSIMIRQILEAIFYFMMFLLLFVYSKQFIDAFTLFQQISEDYFSLSLEGKPPQSYQSSWQSVCAGFSQRVQAGEITAVLTQDMIGEAKDETYVQICKDNLVYQTCDIQELRDLFQADCEHLLHMAIVMNQVGTLMTVMFLLIGMIGLISMNVSVYAFLYLNRIRVGYFEILDVSIFALAITIVYHIKVNLDPGPYSRQEKSVQEMLDNCEIMKEYLMYFFLLLWCRFISFLRKSEKLGSIVKTLELMVRDLVWFLIVLCIGLLAFSTFFYIGYGSTYGDYVSLTQSIFSLTSTIFGGYNLEDKSFVAQTYIVIFLVIFNVVVLNLLIAILSNTYELVAEQGNMEYSLTLYDDYNIFKYNRNFSSVVSFTPPIGSINAVLSPLIYIFHRLKRETSITINNVSFHISYSIYLFMFLAGFLVCSSMVIPFAYLANFCGLLSSSSYGSAGNQSNQLGVRAAKVILWLIFGIPILVLSLLVNDIPVFLTSCYTDSHANSMKIFDISSYEKINVNYLNTIMRSITNKRLKEASQSKQQQQLTQFQTEEMNAVHKINNIQTHENIIQKQDITQIQGVPQLHHPNFIGIQRKNNQPAYPINQKESQRINKSRNCINFDQSSVKYQTISCDEIRDLYERQNELERRKQDRMSNANQESNNNKKKKKNEQQQKHPSEKEGFWLDLFMKRISIQHEIVNEAMLNQLLLEAKKSVLITPRFKYYSPEKIIAKEQQLLSLIDIGLNKNAFQKFDSE